MAVFSAELASRVSAGEQPRKLRNWRKPSCVGGSSYHYVLPTEEEGRGMCIRCGYVSGRKKAVYDETRRWKNNKVARVRIQRDRHPLPRLDHTGAIIPDFRRREFRALKVKGFERDRRGRLVTPDGKKIGPKRWRNRERTYAELKPKRDILRRAANAELCLKKGLIARIEDYDPNWWHRRGKDLSKVKGPMHSVMVKLEPSIFADLTTAARALGLARNGKPGRAALIVLCTKNYLPLLIQSANVHTYR